MPALSQERDDTKTPSCHREARGERVTMMLKYKTLVTRKVTDTDSGTMEMFVLVLILLLIRCMTLGTAPAFFLLSYLFEVFTGWVEILCIYLHSESTIVGG